MRKLLALLALTFVLTGCAVYPDGTVGPAPVAVAPVVVAPRYAYGYGYGYRPYGWGYAPRYYGYRRW